MKTAELLTVIGEPVCSPVITGRYGNATLHAKGFVSADPCYLEHAVCGPEYRFIRDSIRCAYPWEGYDYTASHREWRPFALGHPTATVTAYYRDTGGDGVGFFGNCVDSGCVVVIPIGWLPREVQALFTPST